MRRKWLWAKTLSVLLAASVAVPSGIGTVVHASEPTAQSGTETVTAQEPGASSETQEGTGDEGRDSAGKDAEGRKSEGEGQAAGDEGQTTDSKDTGATDSTQNPGTGTGEEAPGTGAETEKPEQNTGQKSEDGKSDGETAEADTDAEEKPEGSDAEAAEDKKAEDEEVTAPEGSYVVQAEDTLEHLNQVLTEDNEDGEEISGLYFAESYEAAGRLVIPAEKDITLYADEKAEVVIESTDGSVLELDGTLTLEGEGSFSFRQTAEGTDAAELYNGTLKVLGSVTFDGGRFGMQTKGKSFIQVIGGKLTIQNAERGISKAQTSAEILVYGGELEIKGNKEASSGFSYGIKDSCIKIKNGGKLTISDVDIAISGGTSAGTLYAESEEQYSLTGAVADITNDRGIVIGAFETELDGAQDNAADGMQKSTENSAKKSEENSDQKIATDNAQDSTADSPQKCAEDGAQKGVTDSAQKSTEDSAQKNVTDSVQKTAEDSGQKSVTDSVQKSAEDGTPDSAL